MKPVLVAIAGGSGSGKSWLARQLAEMPGSEVSRLPMDDFYHDLSHLPPPQRRRRNFDHPDAIDWWLFRSILDRAVRGETAELPCYDFATHTRAGGSRRWHPAPMVVIDGLWPWRPSDLRACYHYRLFLDASPARRLQRRLERDTRERGRAPESVSRQFRQQVEPMHDRFVQPQIRQAHQILSSPVSPTDLHLLWEHLNQL